VIATGARYRRLAIPRLHELEGAGVYYSATEVEARMCSTRVAVVGGGNSAGQAAIFLSRRGLKVLLLIRGSSLESSMSRYLIDEISREPAITVRYSTSVAGLLGTDRLGGIVVETRGEGRAEHEVDGLFSFIGAEPNSSWLDAGIQRDEDGFILTGADVEDSQVLPLETNRLAVFAVGDVRHGSIKRVATAVGEGAMAVRLVHERLASPAYVLRR
jgi:thioredoxin reductase (NADPH)